MQGVLYQCAERPAHRRISHSQRQGSNLSPMLRAVQDLPLNRSAAGPGMTRYFDMPALTTVSIRKIARLFCLVLIAAHVVHLPVLAHDAHEGISDTDGLHRADGDPGIGHEHGPQVAISRQGPSESSLTGTSDRDVECMTTAATIPARVATLDTLAAPSAIPESPGGNTFSPPAALACRSGAARRHLVLQVLLR